MKIQVSQRWEEDGTFGPEVTVDIPIGVPVAGALTQEGIKFIEYHFDTGMVVRYSKGE